MAYIDTALPRTPVAGLATIKDSLAKYRRYRRTLAELRALPIDSRLDLDLYEGDMPEVARRAVYGH